MRFWLGEIGLTHHSGTRQARNGAASYPGSFARIAGEIFDPFGRLALAFRVGRHRTIAFRQIASGDVLAREILQKPADAPPP